MISNAYVYRHIRLDKNEPFYIGIGCLSNYKRAYEKAKRNKFWYNIVAKTNYEVEILFDNLTWEQAEQKEIEFIRLYGKKDDNTGMLVNLTDGGGGITGKRHTEESKLKIGLASKNRKRLPRTEETKTKLRLANLGKVSPNKGKVLSQEVKDKIAKKLIGTIGPNKGKIMSEETKQKIRDTKKANPTKRKSFIVSEETRQKIRETLIKYNSQKKLSND